MKKLERVAAAGLLALASSSAGALCVDATVEGKNDVGLTAATCVGTGPLAVSCDMNGLHDGLPTHGQFTVVRSPTGAPEVFWVSWTRNGPQDTNEYSCKLSPTSLTGDGWVHAFSGAPLVPKALRTFRCALTPAC